MLKKFAAALLALLGWKALEAPGRPPKAVMIAYPHTSNWDAFYALLVKLALGLDAHWAGKDNMFRPPFGGLLKKMGGVPVNRRERTGFVEQMVAEFASRERFTLVIGHRAFVDFRDRVEVALGEEFQVGDTDYSAKVVEFQPDFAMDLETRTVLSRSQEPRNPAARVLVWRNGAPNDTSWAFLKMPPHFGRRSMLAFQLKRVTFRNHAPVEADSAMLAAPRPTANPHSGSPH